MICTICQNDVDEVVDYKGKLICQSCDDRASQYADRVQARYERLSAASSRIYAEAERTVEYARKMGDAIPFGQPILVGHHSEGRDRRYRERMNNTYERGYKRMAQAEELARRAASAEKNKAIRSDDPTAVIQLKDKIEKLEKLQGHMRETNKTIRKLLKTPLTHEEIAAQVATTHNIALGRALALVKGDYLKRIGYANYQLTNNNAEIRRLKKRLAEEQSRQKELATTDTPVTEEQRGDVTIQRDLEDNRLRLIFPGKPDAETIKRLKSHGFHWSPSNMAWQRQLSTTNEWVLTAILNKE